MQNGKQLYFFLNDLLTYGAHYDATNYSSLGSEFMQFHNGLVEILHVTVIRDFVRHNKGLNRLPSCHFNAFRQKLFAVEMMVFNAD